MNCEITVHSETDKRLGKSFVMQPLKPFSLFKVDLERKRRCGMTRSEILNNIYCPAAGSASDTYKAPEARLSTANAVCIDGSRAALALSWSHHGSRNVDAR